MCLTLNIVFIIRRTHTNVNMTSVVIEFISVTVKVPTMSKSNTLPLSTTEKLMMGASEEQIGPSRPHFPTKKEFFELLIQVRYIIHVGVFIQEIFP